LCVCRSKSSKSSTILNLKLLKPADKSCESRAVEQLERTLKQLGKGRIPMGNFLRSLGRIFNATVTILSVILFIAFACSSCATTSVQSQSCDSLVQETIMAATSGGYVLVQTQQEAVGEIAAFQSGTNVRLYYLTPVEDVAKFLESKGWKAAGQCQSPDGEPVWLLQNEFEIPMDPGAQASK
jgi:hypothetical protein